MAYNIHTSFEKKGNGIKVENAIAFFRNLSEYKISSGIHKDAGLEYVKRAVHTEFGGHWFELPFGDSGIVPPRPAIRMYLYPEMREEITTTYSKGIDSEKKGKLRVPSTNSLEVQKEVGEKCQYLQQEKMIEGGYDTSTNRTKFDPEYNGQKTIAWKGFDDPWISTGETLGKVEYKVTKK